MQEIIKHINDTNASYRNISAGDAKNTDLFLDNEHYDFFKESGSQVTVRFHKENLSKAILFAASVLPRKYDSSGIHYKVNYSKEFVLDQLAQLDGFFMDGAKIVETKTQVWNIRKDVPKKNGEIDQRFYFNGLSSEFSYVDINGSAKTSKFTVRNYLCGGYSDIHFMKSDDGTYDIIITNCTTPYSDDKDCDSSGAIPNYNEYVQLLKTKKNIVLTGAPGTGKTYLAKQIAKDMNAEICFVQFHPSYDYTDFVEGLRPKSAEEGEEEITGAFERVDGVFKAFCKNALLYSHTRSQIQEEEEFSEQFELGSFEDILSTIKNDIVRGILVKYSPSGVLSVNANNRIQYNRPSTFKTILEDNVKLLFDYFVDNNILDISDYTKIQLQEILAQETETHRGHITRTIDFTEYKWTLNELLIRRQQVLNDTLVRNTTPFKKDFVFIIDEINRGELSKIFGELFFAIDPGYRGVEGLVQTQYQRLVKKDDPFANGFYIPENVYIIGTMNDIDRGVEAMDFAIRRRFAWKEVTTEESAEHMGISGIAKVKMMALNNALKEVGLNEAYFIGGAFFLKLEGDDFESLWKYHLKGIISEYFRGEPDADDKLSVVEKAYNEAGKEPETPKPSEDEPVETEA